MTFPVIVLILVIAFASSYVELSEVSDPSLWSVVENMMVLLGAANVGLIAGTLVVYAATKLLSKS